MALLSAFNIKVRFQAKFPSRLDFSARVNIIWRGHKYEDFIFFGYKGNTKKVEQIQSSAFGKSYSLQYFTQLW